MSRSSEARCPALARSSGRQCLKRALYTYNNGSTGIPNRCQIHVNEPACPGSIEGWTGTSANTLSTSRSVHFASTPLESVNVNASPDIESSDPVNVNVPGVLPNDTGIAGLVAACTLRDVRFDAQMDVLEKNVDGHGQQLTAHNQQLTNHHKDLQMVRELMMKRDKEMYEKVGKIQKFAQLAANEMDGRIEALEKLRLDP